MKRSAAIALALLALAFGIWKWAHRAKGPDKAASEAQPLFTGKEPKLKVRLNFPASARSGFSAEFPEIYLTASKGAQVKQVLQLLFSGPKSPGSAAAFPADFKYREVFTTEKGLAVVDLDPDSVLHHPGGTSSEFVSLYCLTRAILDNFKDITRVQVLVGGQIRESLAGHMDISEPLSLESF